MRWPEHVLITGMTSEKEVIFRSRNRMCDLHDSLCDNLFEPLAGEYLVAFTIEHLGLQTANDDAFSEGYWDEDSLSEIETAIHDDFAYDDYVVILERLTEKGWPKTLPAIWSVAPVEPLDD